jgi:hypothetical protein
LKTNIFTLTEAGILEFFGEIGDRLEELGKACE